MREKPERVRHCVQRIRPAGGGIGKPFETTSVVRYVNASRDNASRCIAARRRWIDPKLVVLRCDSARRNQRNRHGKGKPVAKDDRHFGNRLREARLGAGLSQSDLEDISGIPKARLSRYENGHVEPSIQTLNRLARALNVSEASLLGDERAALEEFEAVLKQHGIAFTSKEQ